MEKTGCEIVFERKLFQQILDEPQNKLVQIHVSALISSLLDYIREKSPEVAMDIGVSIGFDETS